MGDTKIPYLTKRWEPVVGCTGEGCASRDQYWSRRLHNRRHVAFEDVQCMPERLDEPLHWRKPRVVGVCFGSDLFGADVPDEFIHRVLAVMAICPHLTFVVLTKQAERTAVCLDNELTRTFSTICVGLRQGAGAIHWPLPNVHLGVSVCNQSDADARLPWLAKLAAAGWNAWISLEPQLEFVDVSPWLGRGILGVIQGVESGPKRRLAKCEACGGDPWVDLGRNETVEFGPCPECSGTGYAAWAWARQTRDACAEAGVSFALKQLPGPDGKMLHMPALDGVTHWSLPWEVKP